MEGVGDRPKARLPGISSSHVGIRSHIATRGAGAKDSDIDLYTGRPYFIWRIEGYTNSNASIDDAVWLDLNDPAGVAHWTSGSVSFPAASGKRGIWLGSWKGTRQANVIWE